LLLGVIGIKSGTEVVIAILSLKSKIFDKTACFTEDTLIYTKDGYKEIKDIEVGDEVYSRNPETGEQGLKRVVNVFVRDIKKLIHLKVGDQEIETTATHPFWVEDIGWVNAIELKPGDKLVMYSGEILELKEAFVEYLDKPIKVYNFEVEDWHTYFVSEYNVFVHNAGCGGAGNKGMTKTNESSNTSPAAENKIIKVIKDSKNTIFKTNANGEKVPYGKRVNINDDYKIIVRRDIGEFSHGDANHYNIEVQTKAGNIKYNMHIYVDNLMNIIKVVD